MADDLPAIADIAIAAYSGYVDAMGREPAPMRADFAAHLADDWLFVAEADSGIAGYMVLCEVNGAWWLDNIATACLTEKDIGRPPQNCLSPLENGAKHRRIHLVRKPHKKTGAHADACL